MHTLQIAIIDSNELSRHGLYAMLNEAKRWRSINLFSNVTAFEATLPTMPTNVVILEDTSTHDPTKLLTRWRAYHPNMIMIVLSHGLTSRYIQYLFDEGVFGFIHRRDCTRSTILSCLEAVNQIQHYISPQASAELYRRETQADSLGLKRVDMDVLQCMADGLNIAETAHRIGLEERSVYRSRQRLREVLSARTSGQVIALALQTGLLNLNLCQSDEM